ncbi:MAG TPA: PEP-CTERM sorting domain-containing protein [Pirellulaceae bacterium]|nr:PEP-CTERM sorting domain-containing protein [Pirellulaceae bacterium]HMO90591.1 PEP-CTERM sorting domain-containing protein [Pirellulaceae bacterium]HMP67830.1 PEP-CTERM sorting domain-containing protein [Pirellulaceae bacterium]
MNAALFDYRSIPVHIIRRLFCGVIVWISVWTGTYSYADLIHQYRLDGTFADDLGGAPLVSGGGSLGPTGYTFAASQGLSFVSGLADPGNYSIETIFHFNELTGYRKIIDFKDLTVDTGLYNISTQLTYYGGGAAGAPGSFSPGVDVRLIVTRDSATNVFTAYINGNYILDFTDSSNLALANGPSNIIHFFMDDIATGGNEAAPGFVDLIRFYNAPLSAAEVAALGGPGAVPEPSSSLVLLFGMTCCAILKRRTRYQTDDLRPTEGDYRVC